MLCISIILLEFFLRRLIALNQLDLEYLHLTLETQDLLLLLDELIS